jgi:hypothetical protein
MTEHEIDRGRDSQDRALPLWRQEQQDPESARVPKGPQQKNRARGRGRDPSVTDLDFDGVPGGADDGDPEAVDP